MNYDQIIATAKMPDEEFEQPGIYFLIQQDVIIYVGQSVNVLTRIKDHWRNRSYVRSFDKYNWIGCEKAILNEVESEMILRFRPKLNRIISPNRRFISFKQVRASRPGFPGVPWRKWDEYCEKHNPQTIEFAGSHYYDVCELLKCPEFKQIVIAGYRGYN